MTNMSAELLEASKVSPQESEEHATEVAINRDAEATIPNRGVQKCHEASQRQLHLLLMQYLAPLKLDELTNLANHLPGERARLSSQIRGGHQRWKEVSRVDQFSDRRNRTRWFTACGEGRKSGRWAIGRGNAADTAGIL